MRLALVGDIHLYRLFVPPWKLLGKALVGQANLWLNRRRKFRPDLLGPVLEQVSQVQPDLLLLSGDLTTTAVAGEFADAAKALAPLFEQCPAVLVPGNHDRYTFESLRKRRIEQVFPQQIPSPLPHLRRLNDGWHLLAMDASVPRAWTSRGRIGGAQLQRARVMLEGLEPDHGVVVLCHYPFEIPPHLGHARWHHALADAAELRAVLADCRAQVLYLHGHVHQPWRWTPPDLPHVIDVNAGAPCLVGPTYPKGQGFWQIDLPDVGGKPPVLTHHLPGPSGWQTREVV